MQVAGAGISAGIFSRGACRDPRRRGPVTSVNIPPLGEKNKHESNTDPRSWQSKKQGKMLDRLAY